MDEACRSELIILFAAAEPDLSDCAVALSGDELFCPFTESLDCCILFEESALSFKARLVALLVLLVLPVPPGPTELFWLPELVLLPEPV